jgi:hypothetical protein
MATALHLWRTEFDKLSKQTASELTSFRSDLQAMRLDLSALEANEQANKASFVRDIAGLKTDYAEILKLRDSLDSYLAAKKDVGAFRELGDALNKLFFGLITKDKDIEERLQKIEKTNITKGKK